MSSNFMIALNRAFTIVYYSIIIWFLGHHEFNAMISSNNFNIDILEIIPLRFVLLINRRFKFSDLKKIRHLQTEFGPAFSFYLTAYSFGLHL